MTIQDFYNEIEGKVQDNEGALAAYGQKQNPPLSESEAQERLYKSALGAALEQYSAKKPQQNGAAHIVNDYGSTVWPNDFYAVCKLASAEYCETLAIFFTHSGDGTLLNTTMTKFVTLGQEFQNRAKMLRTEYDAHMAMGQTPREQHYKVSAGSVTREEAASRLGPDSGLKFKRRIPWIKSTWGS